MEKRDPLKELPGTSGNTDSQESTDDVSKQPDTIPTTSDNSDNKENGFSHKKTHKVEGILSDIGCGSSKSKESKPRRSVLRTFDPLYKDSPEKSPVLVTTSKSEPQIRRQLVIEDSDDSEAAHSTHSVEVSDDDETAFVDAASATEESASGSTVPQNRNLDLEESLLKFYTPEKVYVAHKGSDSESTSVSPEKKSVLADAETPTSPSDQPSTQKETPFGTLDITESEIVSVITKKLGSDSDIIPAKSKFTITESEPENYSIQRDRFSSEITDQVLRGRESASDQAQTSSLTSVSEIRNVSPERSSFSLDTENEEPLASTSGEQRRQSVCVHVSEIEESSDESQEITVVENQSTLPGDSETAEGEIVSKSCKEQQAPELKESGGSATSLDSSSLASESVSEESEQTTEHQESVADFVEDIIKKCEGALFQKQSKDVQEEPQSEPKHHPTSENKESQQKEWEEPQSEPEFHPTPENKESKQKELEKLQSEPEDHSKPENKEREQKEIQDLQSEPELHPTTENKESEQEELEEVQSEPEVHPSSKNKSEQKELQESSELQSEPEVHQKPEDKESEQKEQEEPQSKLEHHPESEEKESVQRELVSETDLEEKFDKSDLSKGKLKDDVSKETHQYELAESSKTVAESASAISEADSFKSTTEEAASEEKTEETQDATSETEKPDANTTTESDSTEYTHQQDEDRHLDSGVDSIEESFVKTPKSSVKDSEDSEKEETPVKGDDSCLPDEKLDPVDDEHKVESAPQKTDEECKTTTDSSAQDDEYAKPLDDAAECKVEEEPHLIKVPDEPEAGKPTISLRDKQKQDIKITDIDTLKTKMADLSEKLSEQQQENSDLKLQLNAIQQAKASLELEIRQKEEIIIKTQAEALKNEQLFKQEIKQLREKLKENSKLIEKDGSKELEDQLKEAKAKEAKAIAELNQRTKDDLNYQKIMEEYETTIAKRFADFQKLKEDYETATRHLANIELAFSDVHQKYERTKALLEGFKTNEETLNAALQASEKTFKQHEEKYESLKAHAKGQIEKSNKEILTLRDKYETDVNKLKAIIKRLEIKCSSLEVSLQQKTEECAALSALCDEVTGKKM